MNGETKPKVASRVFMDCIQPTTTTLFLSTPISFLILWSNWTVTIVQASSYLLTPLSFCLVTSALPLRYQLHGIFPVLQGLSQIQCLHESLSRNWIPFPLNYHIILSVCLCFSLIILIHNNVICECQVDSSHEADPKVTRNSDNTAVSCHMSTSSPSIWVICSVGT